MTDPDTFLSKSNALIQSNKEDTTSFQEADESDEERELTNLNWLLRNQNLTWPKAIDSSTRETLNTRAEAETPVPNNTNIHRNQIKLTRGENTVKKLQVILDSRAQKTTPKRPTPSERFEIFVNKVKRDLTEYEKFANKYETDVTEKPPFNYSHIIGMAMLKNGRITLQQLCAWIEAKFAFFRVRKKWNNSIRHNLSLHHCFRNRKREEKGKGGYWELGVDPKKCDRKRIRNRKLCHSKLNQTAKYHNDQLTHKQQAKSSQPCFSRFAKKVNKNSLSEISETNTLKKISSTLTDDNFTEFLDKGTTDKLNENQYEKCPIQTTIKEDIFQKKLDTIIVSTGEFIAEPQSLSCFISHRIDGINTPVSGEDDFCTFNNINSYSDTTPVFASNTAIIEDRNITNDVSSPSHPCNIRISYDYTNFRPLVDSIDEQFHYLHNRSEFSRNDDILDNLLDVCVRHY
ncbi:uncharacterized protein LOC119555650 [Drosophila subpulchrella]|uniref:uncharacterized protein LOC119555650 n=1 Tax=Drosophila subpulchrella TaxID=1486046 RepID=UPI0018A1791C|nr:uncharacterized protein LOC119555650 [Drosophila subpulchrella]